MVSFNPKRLMVVHAHPDDETLFTGHIIAHALAQGAEVKLVTLTHGEKGQSSNPDLRPINRNSAQMAAYRTSLLSSAVAVFDGLEQQFLGVRAYLETDPSSTGIGRITNPDPLYNLTLTGSGVKAVRDELVPVLKAFRPDTVLTLSRQNSHPDHKMAFRAASKAIAALKTSRPPKHFVVVEPGQKFDLAIGSSESETLKRKAVGWYRDFVTITKDTYDYGTGAIKFSESEKLRLVK
jgi:N-acetyl-1-D-myo-inositol-2-amino-2-deoxy-alpha-D-glucopyranoside deacetylase